MIDLIEQYKKRLENNPNDYTYLLFALQIPSICSRIEFPQTPENTGRCEDGKLYKVNGNPWDANMYKAWLMKHSNSFVDIYYSSITTNGIYTVRKFDTFKFFAPSKCFPAYCCIIIVFRKFCVLNA